MMNILMFTNTYLPHVGGVARSIHRYVIALENKNHSVRVVAPSFRDTPPNEPGVYRIPSIKDFNKSGFSVPLFAPGRVSSALEGFKPDIIHSHHPYLLGNTALRYAASLNTPVVFTHHTLYERYTHYIPGDSVFMRRFVVALATAYCNLCDSVIAPSTSLASLLAHRKVRAPVTIIPTGVNEKHFTRTKRNTLRKRIGISDDAFVLGHVGRLAPEKNLEFLTLAMSHYLQLNTSDHVLIAGVGPMEEHVKKVFARHGLERRLHMLGILDEDELAEAYHAMNVFAFSSQSETQGLVITEAFASGVPVVALDGPGVRDVVNDGFNGRLIKSTNILEFVKALLWVKNLGPEERKRLDEAVTQTVDRFTMGKSVEKVISLYDSLLGSYTPHTPSQAPRRNTFRIHSRLMENYLSASIEAVTPISREIYSCRDNFPEDMELQTLLAHHPGIRARLIGFLISLSIRIQKATWKKHSEGLEYLRGQLSQGEPVLVSFWHGKYLPLFALLEGLHGCIFASCSFRGEVIAEICRRFGYECILIPEHARNRAVEIMAKAILHYGTGAVAADGPRGPRRVFKRGSTQLSSELGMTVIPAAVAMYPKIISKKRWDLYETPLPFGHVYLFIGQGTTVPVGLTSGELDSWSLRLKQLLDTVDETAEQKLAIIRSGKDDPGQTTIHCSEARSNSGNLFSKHASENICPIDSDPDNKMIPKDRVSR